MNNEFQQYFDRMREIEKIFERARCRKIKSYISRSSLSRSYKLREEYDKLGQILIRNGIDPYTGKQEGLGI